MSLASGATAEPTSQDRALAESLFREGKALAKAGEFADACPKFAESERLDPQLGTLLHLATCHEQQGLTASAWAEFSEAADLAQQRGDSRHKLARERAAALEPTLSHLVLRRSEDATPDDVAVRLDDQPVGAAVMGSEVPIDPGSHVVSVSAAGFVTWRRQLRVAADGERIVLELGDLAPIRRLDDSPPPAPVADTTSPMATAGWVVFGVGSATLLAGIGLGIAAAVQRDTADASCDGRFCSDDGLAMHALSQDFATASTALFIAGGITLGTGIVLVLSAPSPSDESAWLSVAPNAGGASFTYGVRW